MKSLTDEKSMMLKNVTDQKGLKGQVRIRMQKTCTKIELIFSKKRSKVTFNA